ncbi:trypsin-like serine protease [Streptomyces sp. H10-C2]|uniref:trypsin-like serine peptidase n=1 Tax=unclassified Streptomyces TaxID=2593676 RepID=UPI0024B88E6E|nr:MULTISPECIES: trypsin-like peptidase domain-containing protein [unclassified Streptomyces]MDJ0345144.1 trypsin-like serine protease [Streptomyces sp. PH10-H1]MDJ0374112.1 trypsin-like serine protease [Streptomyces sp. H10-C2]
MRRPTALRGLVALLLGLLTAVAPGPVAQAADRPGAAVTATTYWTPARMASALPVPTGKRAAAPAVAESAPPSHPFDGLPQVGTFFWSDATNTGRFCGGTVVRSPHHDLVVSAAHCLRSPDPQHHLSFVPQYHDSLTPHGVFPVESIYIDQRYYDLGTGGGARWDYSVVRLGPREDGTEVESAVGGFDLAVYTGYQHRDVRLIGYPGGSDAAYPQPLDCLSSTDLYTSTDPQAPGDFLEIACEGYIGGTSGGPFLMHGPTGYALIGVIGGYHTGGDTPDISYSAYFTDDLLDLYRHAARGDPPATP